jgi:hypothetical protein
MTRPELIHDMAQAINAANDHRAARAEAGVGVIVALVLGILAGLALLHYLTPCETAALCTLSVIPTRPGWGLRLAQWGRAQYLQWRIRCALGDVAAMRRVIDHAREELDYLPRQIDLHLEWIEIGRAHV